MTSAGSGPHVRRTQHVVHPRDLEGSELARPARALEGVQRSLDPTHRGVGEVADHLAKPGGLRDVRVRVAAQDDLVAGERERAVQCVRLPSVGQVDDVPLRMLEPRDRPARELEGPVGRPVRTHDDLDVPGVVAGGLVGSQDRLRDPLLLVVRRHDDRDRRVVLRERRELAATHPADVDRVGDQAEGRQ